MTREQAAIDWIEARWNEGMTVQVQNHLRVIEWTPKTALAFRKAGVVPFTLARDGGLLMAQGRQYVRVLLSCHKVTAVQRDQK